MGMGRTSRISQAWVQSAVKRSGAEGRKDRRAGEKREACSEAGNGGGKKKPFSALVFSARCMRPVRPRLCLSRSSD